MSTKGTDTSVTELRLALVCYGGVSLAIYMHGMTKELHKLVSASRSFDELGGAGDNPFVEQTDTRHAYFEALRSLSSADHRLSVTVDVVAGTSAGGINGVCLAKVLARNGSQDALKRLWIDDGDLKTLLNAPAIGGWKTRAVLAALKELVHLQDPGSPLKGDLMSRLLYDAIQDMDEPVEADRRTLLPAGGTLDLLVTTTDLHGFTVLVGTGSGGMSQRETDHNQVLAFHAGADRDDFDGAGPLSFAARATSCFPGAFAPVSTSSFAEELQGRPVSAADITARFQHVYEGAGDLGESWFVDGGVLDNAPFDLAIDAIAHKRAQSEVVRRLIYLQPDPGMPLAVPDLSTHAKDDPPGYADALRTAVLGVKGSHSILRELVELRALNLRIAEIADIARQQRDQVQTAVEQAWEHDTQRVWDIDSQADVSKLADAIYADAARFVGSSYPGYCRLKVQAVAQSVAGALAAHVACTPASSRASFLSAAVGAWARRRTDGATLSTAQLLTLLGPVDLPYRERRLMFVLAGINELYPQVGGAGRPTRAQLDQLKARAWSILETVRAAPATALAAVDPAVLAFLGPELSEPALYGDPTVFAADHDQAFTAMYQGYGAALAALPDTSSAPLWQAFVDLTGDWDDQHRKGLVARYLGFPLWDSLIFPTIALSQVPQFTPITVSQFSPLAALALPQPAGKLKGVALHHFGAFEDAAWRENDYLWGRLDAAELILRTLRETVPGAGGGAPTTPAGAVAAAGPQLKAALAAVLASEADLKNLAELAEQLSAQVGQLPGP